MPAARTATGRRGPSAASTPVSPATACGDQSGRGPVLRDVRARRPGPLVVGLASGIECVVKTRRAPVADARRAARQRRSRGVDERLDEARVVEVLPDLVDRAARRRRPLAAASAMFSRYWRQPEYDE